jgi:hypothetical protein
VHPRASDRHDASLKDLIAHVRLAPKEITTRTHAIYAAILEGSPYVRAANFTTLHSDDLETLFDLYDTSFFSGQCSSLVRAAHSALRFRISKRMTSAGGKTTRERRRVATGSVQVVYEIAVSAVLLFHTFHDVERPITVTGIRCRDRLEALQRVFEHELVHLVELLLWDRSNCEHPRFQSIAARLFGHTANTHALVTPRERAADKFRVSPGDHVERRVQSPVSKQRCGSGRPREKSPRAGVSTS